MNKNNSLGLKVGSYGRVLTLKEVDTKGKNLVVFLPVVKELANARVLEVNESGSIKVHWKMNYNLSGDFRTELMQFSNNLILDNKDFKERNKIRKANGLVLIKE